MLIAQSDAVIAAVPFFKPKKDFIDFLAANEAKMSWAAIVTGPFFDWVSPRLPFSIARV